MNKKAKRAATAAALVLAMGAGAVGTWAYLNRTSNTLSNTFVAQTDLIGTDGTFSLTEQPVRKLANGTFENYGDFVDATSADQTVEYKGVVPGTTLPKNPKVTVSGLSGDAYVFVVVNNKLTDLDSTNTTQDGIVAEISNEWTQLPNKNNVFYKAVTADQAGFITKTTSEGEVTEPKSLPINVLKDNQVSTTNFTATEANKDLGSLEFKTYLTQQSGFTSASNAWETAFAGVAEGTGAQLAGALTE